ncbi:hypothetical protein CQA53_02845 [Helicobacter didelphidarum]|uniref:Permease n=1 Tax=Helicobacter didelphidarum TaxID=2040648 RepID=A0A3D8IP80_9HELI|nr:LptF/LptG family permease [Helicobacter didelphidarum]RDU66725.1 hypothetical protein CQA53_02845 [Helicobacter didelphidarum]
MLLRRYILKSISEMFFPFFFVLFFISSIILLLNIAVLTNGVKLSVGDLARLYYYGIPANTFFVIALTFYSACILGLSKLSYDSEMLVFFSLGVSPRDIIKILLPLCILVSFILLMFSFVMTPSHKNAYRNFIAHKTQEIDIDLRPGDFGQKIGDWLIYIDSKQDQNTYLGLVLYSDSTDQIKENFIIAKKGIIRNEQGVLELILYDGEAYFYDKELLQRTEFKEMIVRNFLDESNFSVQDLYEYWSSAFMGDSKQLKRLSQSFCTSLFPLVSIFFMLVFGIKNPRFHKNYSYFYVLGSGSFYLITMYLFSMKYPFLSLFLPLIWLICGWYFYHKYIKRFY